MNALTQRPAFWVLAAVGLSALTAAIIAALVIRGFLTDFRPSHGHHPAPAPAHGMEGGTFHDWLHDQLRITPEQETSLALIEQSYAITRTSLLARIEAAGHQLADALGTTPVDQAAIDAALAEIQEAQGNLQKSTISHFLEMKEHLAPDQAGKLLQWTRESIAHEHGH